MVMELISQVVAAVESLYDDELKPYARLIRKRLEERASQMGLGSLEVDMRQLRVACGQCPVLMVGTEEEGGDWFVLLTGRREAFVDVYSPQDVYPPQLWLDAACYFKSLGEADKADMVLPGGRYSCAQVLRERRLPFLEGRTLGQVSHIVQLSISQKKLLGYCHGAVVPYNRSQTMLKDKCAQRQRPCAGSDRCELVSWGEVRTCLQEILGGLVLGKGFVPLSSIKRLFRSRFGKTLSETALGHAKLSELFQDSRLCDLCAVRLQGHGYVLVPQQQQQPSNRTAVCLADQVPTYLQHGAPWMPFGDHTSVPQSMRTPAPAAPAPVPSRHLMPCHAGGSFVQQPTEYVPTTASIPEQFTQPLPMLLGSLSEGFPTSDCTTYCDPRHTVYAPTATKQPDHMAGPKEQEARHPQPKTRCMQAARLATIDEQRGQPFLTTAPVTSLEIEVKNTFINIALPSSLASASASRRTRSCPRHV
jgi:hypothetical protein